MEEDKDNKFDSNNRCTYDETVSCAYCAWSGKCTCDEHEGRLSEQSDDIDELLNDALGG